MRTEFEQTLIDYNRQNGLLKYLKDALENGQLDEIEQLVIKAEKGAKPDEIREILMTIGRKVFEDCISFIDDSQYPAGDVEELYGDPAYDAIAKDRIAMSKGRG